jgi:hypothetical protein
MNWIKKKSNYVIIITFILVILIFPGTLNIYLIELHVFYIPGGTSSFFNYLG